MIWIKVLSCFLLVWIAVSDYEVNGQITNTTPKPTIRKTTTSTTKKPPTTTTTRTTTTTIKKPPTSTTTTTRTTTTTTKKPPTTTTTRTTTTTTKKPTTTKGNFKTILYCVVSFWTLKFPMKNCLFCVDL